MPAQPYIKDFSKHLPTQAIENFTRAMANFSKMLQVLDLSPWQENLLNEALVFRTFEEQRKLFDERDRHPFGHWSSQGRGYSPLVSYIDEVPYFNSELYILEEMVARSLHGKSLCAHVKNTPLWIVLAAERGHYDKALVLPTT